RLRRVFFSSGRRHTRSKRDWSSDVCSSDLGPLDHYREITSAGVPLVLVNGVREELDASFLSTDDEHAMRAVLTHLHDLGHRRVGLAVAMSALGPSARRCACSRRSRPPGPRALCRSPSPTSPTPAGTRRPAIWSPAR